MTKRKLAQFICELEGKKVNLPIAQVMEVLTCLEILEGETRAKTMEETGMMDADTQMTPVLKVIHDGSSKVAFKAYNKKIRKQK